MVKGTLTAILIGGVMLMNSMSFGASAQNTVRKAAVAGTFYEKNPKLLREVILRYLSDARPLSEPVRLMICPHAGFVFSGPVAAKGYAAIDGNAKRVIIIGPSHYEAFRGVAVPRFDYYETPLGRVKIDREVVDRLSGKPGVIAAEEFDEPEHCLEVQLPFLQVQLTDFTIVPLLVGKADPKQVAELLMPFIDKQTVVVASSDFSHYEEQKSARLIDDTSIASILSGEENGTINACGVLPIRIVMHLGKQLGLKPVKLDARTSYDTAPQHCPKTRVVGYAAIAYVSPEAARQFGGSEPERKNAADALSDQTKTFLLGIARGSLEAAVTGTRFAAPADVPEEVKEHRGCFVTLTAKGALRGCIGYIEPIKPLLQAVIDNAANAALNDPRFPKVTSDEVAGIKIEISVLTPPEPLHYKNPEELLARLVPGRDGVILRNGNHQSTYLPQVWEQLPGKVAFLEQLSLKGGMPRDGWKHAEVSTYRAVHFEE